MPAIDNIIMQILGMSEARYNGLGIIGWSQYDQHRPSKWPTAFCLLDYYGFSPDGYGWQDMIQLHIIRDYTATYDEYTFMWPTGLPICKATYQRTGRMILR